MLFVSVMYEPEKKTIIIGFAKLKKKLSNENVSYGRWLNDERLSLNDELLNDES